MLATHSTTVPTVAPTALLPAPAPDNTKDPHEHGRAQLQRWRRFEFGMWLGFENQDAPWSWDVSDQEALLDFLRVRPEWAVVQDDIELFGFAIDKRWFADPVEMIDLLVELQCERELRDAPVKLELVN